MMSLLLQEQYHERIRADESTVSFNSRALTCDHARKHSNRVCLKVRRLLKSVGVDVSKTDRGGEAAAQ